MPIRPVTPDSATVRLGRWTRTEKRLVLLYGLAVGASIVCALADLLGWL